MCVVREQLARIVSLPMLCGSWGLNTGLWAWHRAGYLLSNLPASETFYC